ncbi:COG3521 Predicted component of the type VI protein secretion system [Rhabdaerophilaceae bacterium]
MLDLGFMPDKRGNGFNRRAVLFAPFLIAGCASNKPPPSLKISMTVEVDDLVNVNDQGLPSPIVVRIYELKSNSAFEQSAFFDLFDNDTAKLGTDMLGRRELELKPGDKLTFLREVAFEARYVGVIGGYRELGKAEWRSIAEIVPERDNEMLVRVLPLQIQVVRTNASRPLPF